MKGFECSLELVSRNHGLVDKDITQDNDLKYVFNNVFDHILKGALDITEVHLISMNCLKIGLNTQRWDLKKN